MAETLNTIPNPEPREPLQAEMDRRRGAAEVLLRAGYTQTSIASYLNVTQVTISRWSRLMGITGKPGRPRRGQDADAIPEALISPEARLEYAHRPTFLTLQQIRQVRAQKRQWTGPEFADALFAAYGVRYSRSQTNALLAEAGRKDRAAEVSA